MSKWKTDPELLRNRKFGNLRFRRQHTIGQFIVDFYCAELRLAIEVDGPIHLSQEETDLVRQGFIEAYNVVVVRFTNDRVLHQTDEVLETLAIVAERLRTST